MSHYLPPQPWEPEGPPLRSPELTCPACGQPAWVLRALRRDGARVLRGCQACADALEARERARRLRELGALAQW